MKEKIFKNLSLKILSVVFAVVLWTIIVNIYDPTTSYTFSNVSVQLINTESLTDKNYSYEIVDGDSGMDLDLSDRDGNHSDQKKQNSGKETVRAAGNSGNIASGMEYREFTPSASDQNNCRRYDSGMLPFDG